MPTISAYTSGPATPDTVIHKFVTSTGMRASYYNPNLYAPQSHRPSDVAVFDTQRGNAKIAKEMHGKDGSACILIDLGYIKRASADNKDGYFQVSLDNLGWLPLFSCEPSRFAALGVKVHTRKGQGEYGLILAQVPKDAAHGMDEAGIRGFVDEFASKIEKAGYKAVVRPHPGSKLVFNGVTTHEGSLEEAIEGAAFVVTYNSTAAVEAIIAGVPVFCHGSAHYACVANRGTFEKPEVASVAERTDYLQRLAYAQWTPVEIEEGKAWAFIQDVLDGNTEKYRSTEVYDAPEAEKLPEAVKLPEALPTVDAPSEVAAEAASEDTLTEDILTEDAVTDEAAPSTPKKPRGRPAKK